MTKKIILSTNILIIIFLLWHDGMARPDSRKQKGKPESKAASLPKHITADEGDSALTSNERRKGTFSNESSSEPELEPDGQIEDSEDSGPNDEVKHVGSSSESRPIEPPRTRRTKRETSGNAPLNGPAIGTPLDSRDALIRTKRSWKTHLASGVLGALAVGIPWYFQAVNQNQQQYGWNGWRPYRK